MEGLLSEDVLNIDKYIINGIDFDLKLYPSRSAFVLMSDSPQKEYRIIIEEAILKCYTVDISNAIVSTPPQVIRTWWDGTVLFLIKLN